MTDARMDESWKIYESLGFVPIIEEGCDGLARCKVAVEEIYHSFTLIENAINEIPDGEICTEVKTLTAVNCVRLNNPMARLCIMLRLLIRTISGSSGSACRQIRIF